MPHALTLSLSLISSRLLVSSGHKKEWKGSTNRATNESWPDHASVDSFHLIWGLFRRKAALLTQSTVLSLLYLMAATRTVLYGRDSVYNTLYSLWVSMLPVAGIILRAPNPRVGRGQKSNLRGGYAGVGGRPWIPEVLLVGA